MLRNYKTVAPSKQVLLAICTALDMNAEETDMLLRKYGYCLSDSIAEDIIVKWHMDNNDAGQGTLIDKINSILDDTGLPLLMTKQKN